MTSLRHAPDSFLVFSLGAESFAVPFSLVKEVRAIPELTRVPKGADAIIGIMNHHGRPLAVHDLATCLGIDRAPLADSALLICELDSRESDRLNSNRLNSNRHEVAIRVDSVLNVIDIRPSQISLRSTPGRPTHPAFSGVYLDRDRLIVIVELKKALSLEGAASAA